MQAYGAIAALPVSIPSGSESLNYLTLSEALALMLIRIEEINEEGSVPQLKVSSIASDPVLLISGEELKGAKQNRILNTSILVPASATVVIPVSCTERGRWSYASPDFKESGNISSRNVRQATNESVYFSLNGGRGHDSDQGKIWNRIEELHSKSKTSLTSPTRAMDDAFKARKHDLQEAQRHFSLIPGQTGILFFHAGKAAGLDILSRPGAYARIHDKLVKSYIIDGLEGQETRYRSASLISEAHAFFGRIMNATVKVFKSPGLGDDHRIQSPGVNGSALVCHGEIVHFCCFSVEAEEERMAGFNSRKIL